MARSYNSAPLWRFTYPDGKFLVLTVAVNPANGRVGLDFRVRSNDAFGEGVRFNLGDVNSASARHLEDLIAALFTIRDAVRDGTLHELLPAGPDDLPTETQPPLFGGGGIVCEQCKGTGWAPSGDGSEVVECSCRRRFLASRSDARQQPAARTG